MLMSPANTHAHWLLETQLRQRNMTAVFYSTTGGSALADTGLPTAFYANQVTVSENGSGYILHPDGRSAWLCNLLFFGNV